MVAQRRDVEMDRRAFVQRHQDVEQRIAVLAMCTRLSVLA